MDHSVDRTPANHAREPIQASHCEVEAGFDPVQKAPQMVPNVSDQALKTGDQRCLTPPPTLSTTEQVPTAARQTPIELASKLDYCRVEEAWDEDTLSYKIVKSASPNINDLDQYVFVVRNRNNQKTHRKTAFIDIKSTTLRDILRKICQDIRGVSLADEKPSVEQNILFHVRDELYQQQQDGLGANHLRLLVDFVKATFRPVLEHLNILSANNEITYDLLWALFEPNAEIYTICGGTDAPRCLLYNHCEEKTERDGSRYLYLEVRYLNSDGKILGEVITSTKIPHFRGAKRIEHLHAYPLRYHPDREKIRNDLIECGRKFVELMGVHHRHYEGTAFTIDDEGEVVTRHVKGRIMVDAMCFQECNPFHPCPRVQKVVPQYSASGPCDTIKLTDIDPSQLRENEYLICSPTVLGFCLKSKKFLEFAVANVHDIEWSPFSFDDVKIPERQKRLVWALTDTYLRYKHGDEFYDWIQEKGRGINFLLYGPPGVGKTLTAEMIAESSKVPLYTIPAGQIGVDPVQVETLLAIIFKIVGRWKAILLIDEADVFLAQRSDNPQLNALISVFLRELEQYDGILFLTTNRIQSFDEAMISRIHLALKYEALGKNARKAIWQSFLSHTQSRQGSPAYHQGLVDKLAERDLNGREASFISHAEEHA